MVDYDKVPWQAVHEYLLGVECASTKTEFFSSALTGIQRLIPSDVSTCLFERGGRILASEGFSEADCQAFNDYYRLRIPFIPDPGRTEEAVLSRIDDGGCDVVEWRDYADSEFVVDFAAPQGCAHNLICAAPGIPVVLSLHRSGLCPTYSDVDRLSLAVISPHIANLYSSMEKLTTSSSRRVCEDEIREKFPRITHREAQVAALLCRSLTAPEIASKLFLSVRTVESHIETLYMKLGVRNKRTAVARLTETRETLENHGDSYAAFSD
jgi:DNA-binding CsgD family transcriptional regulator